MGSHSGRGTDASAFVFDLGRRSLYHAQTIWLFTFSDLKTILVPSFIFGVSNALTAPAYGIPSSASHFSDVIWRAPLILLWVWVNLLPFDINNQRSSAAIAEDAINKPWRPLPRRRIAPSHAQTLMVCFYVLVPIVSCLFRGGLRQGLCLVLLGTWYNNFGGADSHPIIRNAINASGYLCFISGAMEVALATPIHLSTAGSSSRLLQWFCILGGVIMTTVHTQDMYDQEGDSVRGRRTLPLVIGDGPARWTIAVFMLVWGMLCPAFWGSSFISWVLNMGLAASVSIRSLVRRTVSDDKTTFVIWNCWIASLYVLPLFAKRTE